MDFLATLIETVITLVIMGAIALGGIYTGKYLRKRKNAK